MAFCGQCGAKLEDSAKFCSNCGAAAPAGQPGQQQTGPQAPYDEPQGQARQQGPGKAEQAFQSFHNTPDETAAYARQDIDQNKTTALFAYLFILIILPIAKMKDSPFCKFHANQGLTLLIAEVAWSIVYTILTRIFWIVSWVLGSIMSAILSLVWLAFLVFIILGIVNAAQGKAKELPLIGKIRLIQ